VRPITYRELSSGWCSRHIRSLLRLLVKNRHSTHRPSADTQTVPLVPVRSGEGLQASPETSKKSPDLPTNHL